MAYRLTDLDRELLGEMSGQIGSVNNYNTPGGNNRLRLDNTSSGVGAGVPVALGSQPPASSHPNTNATTSSSKKRDASKDLCDSDSGSPTKKRYSRQASTPSEKAIPTKSFSGNRRSSAPMKVLEVKTETSLKASNSLVHEYPTRTRAAAKRERQSIFNLVTPDTCKPDDNLNTHNDKNVNVPTKHHFANNHSSRQLHHPGTDVHVDEGGVDSEVERGATNLWSMLKTADGANSDAEDNTTATTQTSFKTTVDSSQSSLASNTSLDKSKSTYLSTVLNELTVEPDKCTRPSGPSQSGERLSPTNKLPEKMDPVSESNSSPPKRVFRRRQVLRYDDPEATEDDSQPTTCTPRKLHKSSTYPGPSNNNSNKVSSTSDPKTPSKLCKTTGKPFDRSITVRATPRKRAPPLADFVSDQIAIPTSWAEAGDADKKLIQMKEEGNSWEAIRKMWREATGQDVAPSTLPNRYNRVKANLTVLGDCERATLLQTVAEVEKAQKMEKWARVAAMMHSRGAGKYPPEYLQKQFSLSLSAVGS